MVSARVLVVDDDPDIIDYFSSFLGDLGYEVRSAPNGESALAMLGDFNPNIVLLDVLMPGKSGLDLLVRIRRHPHWRDLPVVVVTGNDQILGDDCRSYLSSFDDVAGPDAVLGKPVDREVLVRLLEELSGPNGGQPA